MADLNRSFQDALAALNNKDLKRAEDLFKRVIKIDRSHVPALNLLVVVLMSIERFAEAEPLIARATLLNQNSDVSFYNYGLISRRLNKPQQALENFGKALRLNPNVAETWNSRGAVFNDLEQYDVAIADFDKAISLNAAYSEAYANKGKSLALLKRHEEAFAAYDQALSIKADLAEAWLGRGNVFYDLKRYEEACAAYDKALSIKPDLEGAWLGRGNAFYDLKRYDDAFAAYDKALSIKADLAEAWLGRGNAFYDLKRYDEASAAYDQALSIKPDLERAWLGRGNVFAVLKRYEDAFVAYDRALSIRPDLEIVEGARLRIKMQLCDWDNLETEISNLTTSVRTGRPCPPFALLSLTNSPDDQLRCAQAWVATQYPQAGQSIWRGSIRAHDKIRVGYVSPDFRTHPVAYLMAGVFEHHHRARFETCGFSIGASDDSDLRHRLEKSFHKFFDLFNKSDSDIVSAIKSAEIDILVDLAGYTQSARPSLFGYRPAPIIVNYLGFAGTLGGKQVWDYVVADKVVAPAENGKFFAEKLVWLPGCFMPRDDKDRAEPDQVMNRIDHGLPDRGFVFCCFNNTYKINPPVFKAWMNVLRNVDGSVLWLSDAEATAKGNLRKEAKKIGIDPDRIVFAKRLASTADHLARHRLADLFLDTLPYNAHTTASDALWAGLPVLTQIGNTFAARVAASLLDAVGLPELITRSREEYEALAIELARNRDRLKAITEKLAKNRLTAPLFDTALYTRNLEAAYEAMVQRHQAGLPPGHIEINA